MRISVRSSAIARLGGAVAALWLCGVGPAWAGSGASAKTIQELVLNPLCDFLGITSCYELPTVVQIVQAVSGLENIAPNFVRSQIIGAGLGLDQTSGACTVAGNFGFVPCDTLAVNAVNPLAPSSIGPSDLSALTPLAFNNTSGHAVPVPLGTSGANSFFYAVLTGAPGQHVLDLLFDYPSWTTKQFTKGQPVATIIFQLVMLNGSTETPVSAALQLTATCNGAASCLAGTVSGLPGTGTQPPSAAQLGIQFGYQFGSSPSSQTPHGTLELQLPVIATQATDPAYFGATPPGNTNGDTPGSLTFINQASGLPTAFLKDDRGFAANFLGAGVSVGVAPYPWPLCTASTCPANPTTPPATSYGVCASIAGARVAATFVSVGTDGTAYASSQVASPPPQCP